MQTPEGDTDAARPSAARMYDYYLGGSHNLQVDRDLAAKAIELWPELPQIMQANRAFLRRAVRYLVDQGVTQFLDIGSGIPTVGNVHEVAKAASPEARVVYVDSDQVAVEVGRELLRDDDQTDSVLADLRDVEAVLGDPRTTRLLDLSQPIAVLMVAVLHFVPDDWRPGELIERYRTATPSGSYLAISHATFEGEPDQAGPHMALYRRTGSPMTMRSHEEVVDLFEGYDLVGPGVVYMADWRPDEGPVDRPERFPAYAGVGRSR